MQIAFFSMGYTRASLWEQFNAEREQLQIHLSQQIRTKMASLVNFFNLK